MESYPKEKERNNGGFFSRLLAGSAILGALTRFSNACRRKLSEGVFGAFFTSYGKLAKAAKKSFLLDKLQTVLGLEGRGAALKRKIAAGIEDSAIVRLIKKLTDALCGAYLRVWGMFFASFGAYTLLVFLIRTFAEKETDLNPLYWLIPLVCLPISIPMFFSEKRMGDLLADSAIAGTLLFGLLGLRRDYFERRQTSGGKKNAAFITGMLFGALTFALDPGVILTAFLAVLFFYTVLLSPEAGLLLTFFFFPFLSLTAHPTATLFLLVLPTAFSLGVKAVRGKRYLSFDPIDAAVLFFGLVLLCGGFFTAGGSYPVSLLVSAGLMLGFFLCAELLTSAELLRKAIRVLLFGAAVTVLYGLIAVAAGRFDPARTPEGAAGGLARSFFALPSSLGSYLVLLLPFAFCEYSAEGEGRKRFFGALFIAASFACLLLTGESGAIAAGVIAVLFYLLMHTPKTFSVLLLLLVFLPFCFFLLPEEIKRRVLTLLSEASVSAGPVLRASLGLLRQFWLGGIGAGTDSFGKVYDSVVPHYAEGASDAGSLFLQIFLSLGIVGLLAFLAMVLVFAVSSFTVVRYEGERRFRLIGAASLAAITGALVNGISGYIWNDYRIFFLFFSVFGIGTAARRCGDRERERRQGLSLQDKTSCETVLRLSGR